MLPNDSTRSQPHAANDVHESQPQVPPRAPGISTPVVAPHTGDAGTHAPDAVADLLVPDLVALMAAAAPDAPAVVCGERIVSYGALNRRANQLAHHLRALGAGPETLVLLCVDRSADLVV